MQGHNWSDTSSPDPSESPSFGELRLHFRRGEQDAWTPNQALFLTAFLPFCHILKDLTTSFLYATSNYLLNAAH